MEHFARQHRGGRVERAGDVVAHRRTARRCGVDGDRHVPDQRQVPEVGEQRSPRGDPSIGLLAIGEIEADGGAAQDRGERSRPAVVDEGVPAATAVVDVDRPQRCEDAWQVVAPGVVGQDATGQLGPACRAAAFEPGPANDDVGEAEPADPDDDRTDHDEPDPGERQL